MKEEGLCFVFNIDESDFNRSNLAVLYAEKYKATGELDGVQVSLSELNKDLF